MFETYPDMLTLEEFMEILQIGKNSTYELLDSGKLKCFRIGKKYKIPKKANYKYIVGIVITSWIYWKCYEQKNKVNEKKESGHDFI